MSDIVRIDDDELMRILHGTKGLDIGKPFSREIFLVEVHIAGTTHIKNIEELEPRLKVGTHLKFLREPDNVHDDLAILIQDAEGNKLGYIPRAKNEILSRLMDAGKLLYGIVHEKEFLRNWLKIQIQVFLSD